MAIFLLLARLPTLYADPWSVRRLLASVKLDPARIPFNTTLVNTWYFALLEAERQERLLGLVELMLEEYPLDEYLVAAHETIIQEALEG